MDTGEDLKDKIRLFDFGVWQFYTGVRPDFKPSPQYRRSKGGVTSGSRRPCGAWLTNAFQPVCLEQVPKRLVVYLVVVLHL
jgi:hypothetical protein